MPWNCGDFNSYTIEELPTMTCLHYWSSRSEHRGMTTWLNYIIETSRNKHWVPRHKIHRWIHYKVTNTSTSGTSTQILTYRKCKQVGHYPRIRIFTKWKHILSQEDYKYVRYGCGKVILWRMMIWDNMVEQASKLFGVSMDHWSEYESLCSGDEVHKKINVE